ncbi:MAG: hypothetical protein BZY82_07450 [SAR202 cluster bacterium Io17-Chloro-G3]|nr:MAG: hypothetical protein BZY82_07450 [SAR202 cluster bacterium Io17-Chloro-G3]
METENDSTSFLMCEMAISSSHPQPDIRGISLLPKEDVLLSFHPSEGLSFNPPVRRALHQFNAFPENDSLLLTNQRIFASFGSAGKYRFCITAVEEVTGVSFTTPSRQISSLIAGAALLLAGIVAGIAIDSLGFSMIASLAVFASLVGLGAISVSKFFVPDKAATVAFSSRSLDIVFPLHTHTASQDARILVSLIFELKTERGIRYIDEGSGNSVDSSGSESEETELPVSHKEDARYAGEDRSDLSQENSGAIPSDTEK